MFRTACRILLLIIISNNTFSQTFSKQSTSYTPLKFLINAQAGGYWGIGDSANTIQLIRFNDTLGIIMTRLFSDTGTVTVSFLKQEANGHILFGGNSSNFLNGFLVEADTNGNVLFSLYPHNNQRIRSASISPHNELYVLISYDSAWNEMRFISKLDSARQLNWTLRSDHVVYSENPVACEFLNNILYVFSNNPDGFDLKMRVETFDSSGFSHGTTEWAFGAPGVPDQQFLKTQSGNFVISGIGLPINTMFVPTCDIICVLSGQNLIRQRGFMFLNGGSYQQASEFKSCVSPDGSIVTAGGIGDSILIIKMDSLLNIHWRYIVDNNGNSSVSAIVNSNDHGFILMLNKSGSSVFLKYDSLGQSICGNLPYSGDSIVPIPSPTSSGSILQKLSSIIADSLFVVSTSSSYILSDYCIPLVVKEENKISYSIFPNPSSSIVNILAPNIEPYEILLMNINGNIIINDMKLVDNKLDVSILPSAVYFIRIQSESCINWQRFIKE